MKRLFKKRRDVVKGMPSAVVLSILIHAALFLLAGMLVVFTVVKKEEKKFVPPKAVERPKMKLRKPKVKVKKNTKPKPTTRIVTKMNRASMPDIQLPEMSGLAKGLGDGIGGFDMMPELDNVSVFGSGQSIGNDLVGTFYNFNRDRGGRRLPPLDYDNYKSILLDFFRKDWRESLLARYYRSPNKLYATTICVPAILSTRAPEAFGEPPDTEGWCWATLYTGQLVHKDDITFRFWGSADDILMVRVDGKVVLNACYHNDNSTSTYSLFSPIWQSSSPDSFRYWMGNRTAVVGDWITLKAGESQDIEVLIGEVPGGAFCAMLTVEVEGVEYPKSPQGGPLLPIFKTAEPSLDLLDAIYNDLIPGEACLTNGPVFSDYDTGSRTSSKLQEKVADPLPDSPPQEASKNRMRTWHLVKGNTFEAEFMTMVAGKAVLKDPRGRQRKIPIGQLSEADRKHIELARPPRFNIDFSKKTSQWRNLQSPTSNTPPPTMLDYAFTAKLKQISAGDYPHKLHVELHAVSKQELGRNIYRLVSRAEGDFVPAESDGAFRISGNNTTLYTYSLYAEKRGERYAGYLVVVTDERGEIIQHAESSKWLFDNLSDLRKLPVGRYMDRECKRTFPVGPKPYFH